MHVKYQILRFYNHLTLRKKKKLHIQENLLGLGKKENEANINKLSGLNINEGLVSGGKSKHTTACYSLYLSQPCTSSL